MFDLGWSELLLLAVLAIIVVGPKDLPRMMRTIGRHVAKARAMAQEFQRSFDEIAREADLDEFRREVATIKNTNMISDLKKDIESDQAAAPASTDSASQSKPDPDTGLDLDIDADVAEEETSPVVSSAAKP